MPMRIFGPASVRLSARCVVLTSCILRSAAFAPQPGPRPCRWLIRTWPEYIGAVAEVMDELEKATVAYENALRHNPFKVSTLAAAAEVYRRSARPALAVTTSVQEPLIIFPVPTSLSVSSLSSPSLCVPSVCPARPPLLAKVPRGAQAREPAQGVRLSPARGEGALSRTCLSSTPCCTRFRLTLNPPPARP